MSIVATDFRCWCAMATPPAQAVADESACEAGSNKGALVFYHYDGGLGWIRSGFRQPGLVVGRLR